MSRTPPPGTPRPQWGRGGQDPLGPGNWRGQTRPRDNRPPTVRGGIRGWIQQALGCGLLILFAFGSAVLGIAGLVDTFGGAL